MSGAGAPTLAVQAPELRVAVIAASWHSTVMDGLLDGARRGLGEAGVPNDQITEVRVPGSFELGVACARLAPEHDALVALGVVIRGGTPHFEYVCQAATSALSQVAVSTGTPVGFGLLTCDDEAQALARAGLAATPDRPASVEDKGHEAATAAVATAATLRAVLPTGN